MTIVANPRNYKIPDWFLNRQKDHKTGRFTQVGGLNRSFCYRCRLLAVSRTGGGWKVGC